MMLFWGVLGMTVSVIFFFMLLLSERNPEPVIWKSDFLTGGIFVPMIVGAGIIGLLAVIRYFMNLETLSFSGKEPVMAAGVVVAGAVVLKAMRIKKRLARYTAQAQAAGAAIHPIQKPAILPEPPVAGRRAA
ncbi:MAG: hypothetical protein ABIL58_26750 [Pseudomonadota bacterium]